MDLNLNLLFVKEKKYKIFPLLDFESLISNYLNFEDNIKIPQLSDSKNRSFVYFSWKFCTKLGVFFFNFLWQAENIYYTLVLLKSQYYYCNNLKF